jgi:hypothetical protein
VASHPFDDPLSDPTRAGSTGPDPTLAPAGGFVTRPTPPVEPPTPPVEPPTQPLPTQPVPTQPASQWAHPDSPAYAPPPYPLPARPAYRPAGTNQPGWPASPPSYPSGYPTQPVYPTPVPTASRPSRSALFFMIAGLVSLAVVAVVVGASVGRNPSGSPTGALNNPGNNDPFAGIPFDPFGSSTPFPLNGGGADGAKVAAGDQTDRLPLGRTVHLTNGANAWTVTVTAASWVNSCPDVTLMNGRELEATVVVKVTQGRASVSPLDFSYSDPDGLPGIPVPLMGCGSGPNIAILSAGTDGTYTIDFDVLGQTGGLIGYGGLVSPIARWVAPS